MPPPRLTGEVSCGIAVIWIWHKEVWDGGAVS